MLDATTWLFPYVSVANLLGAAGAIFGWRAAFNAKRAAAAAQATAMEARHANDIAELNRRETLVRNILRAAVGVHSEVSRARSLADDLLASLSATSNGNSDLQASVRREIDEMLPRLSTLFDAATLAVNLDRAGLTLLTTDDLLSMRTLQEQAELTAGWSADSLSRKLGRGADRLPNPPSDNLDH